MHLVYAPKKPNLIRLLVLVHNSSFLQLLSSLRFLCVHGLAGLRCPARGNSGDSGGARASVGLPVLADTDHNRLLGARALDSALALEREAAGRYN
jgi:hypothetical protein